MDAFKGRFYKSLFLKEAASLEEELQSGERVDQVRIRTLFNILKKRFEKLSEIHEKISEELFAQQVDEKVIEEQFSEFEKLEFKFNFLENVVKDLCFSSEKMVSNPNVVLCQNNRPDITNKFGGEVSEWIGFWTQFSKIHLSNEYKDETKFDILLRSLKPGSPALRLVEVFPPSKENYSKAVELLKSRFGKEEFLIEYYIRQLLSLILEKCSRPLSQLYDQLEAQLKALGSLGVAQDKYAAMLFPLVESAIPENVFKIWERHRISRNTSIKNPDECLRELLDFLKVEVEGEERLKLRKSSFMGGEEKGKSKLKEAVHIASGSALVATGELSEPTETSETFIAVQSKPPGKVECVFCSKNHISLECNSAVDMTLKKRLEQLQKKGACFKCLKVGHMSTKCKVFVKCVICKGHHSHLTCNKLEPNSETKIDYVESPKALVSGSINPPKTYLQTLVAYLLTNVGLQKVRILLDSGSDRSYITKECAARHNLIPTKKVSIAQEVFGGKRTGMKSHNIFNIHLKSCVGDFEARFEVLDQNLICGRISRFDNIEIYEELKKFGIYLSDLEESESDKIDILLGADAWPIIYTTDHKAVGSLLAIRTKLGWTLLGNTGHYNCLASTFLTIKSDEEIDLTKFWELELLGIKDPISRISKREKENLAWEIFNKTVRRDNDGRYIIRLPWLEDVPKLMDNFDSAKKRLFATSKLLEKWEKFEDYNKVFEEWLSLGIIEQLPTEDYTKPSYYLPHRAVFKEVGTTKIRPVFDASNQDNNGLSLNNLLDPGPNMIEQVPVILMSFRLGQVAASADIEKAFLQIVVDPVDRDVLRFLWWRNGEIIIFRHCRVVFGVTSSPFLLAAVLRHHCMAAPLDYQETAKKLLTSFYVDNCLISVNSENELNIFIRQSVELLAMAQFNVRGWVSNIHNDKIENVLGILWNCAEDTLSLNLKTLENLQDGNTKRSMLSVVQRIFDPLGFISPVIIVPKILLQQTWSLKNVGWDNILPKDINAKFTNWLSQLQCLFQMKLFRYVPVNESSTLHVFCDASQLAYGACIFIRTVREGKVNINLIMSKSRVAPKKSLTLPRLELMAGVIGVRITQLITSRWNFPLEKMFFWTDSIVLLYWIANEGPWSVFVANRVKEIKEFSEPIRWRHVPGVLNPADLLSRGCKPQYFFDCKWWEGPTWLREAEEKWPSGVELVEPEEATSERRKTAITCKVSSEEKKGFLTLFERYSNYSFIVKIFVHLLNAVCLFCPNFSKHCGLSDQDLTYSEKVMNSEIVLFRCIQKEYFEQDAGKTFLKSLDTYLDDRGLVRLKSRLVNDTTVLEFRYPIILPGKHTLVQKFIRHEHLKNNHAGTLSLLVKIRERIWLTQGRRSVAAVVKKCVRCKRYQGRALEVPVPPLPKERIHSSATFESVGIDLAGPIFLRGSKGKHWIIMFACAVYRAVHLDIVTSLSTEALIMALRRFIARRGRPKIVFSDNGTNFKGLDNAWERLDWKKLEEESGLQRITWRFNPPSTPWWGGFWERLIGVMKDLLRKNLGRASLYFEEMSTLLCEIEAMINNRPLTYVSEDPNELSPLIPAMFLMGLGHSDSFQDLNQINAVSLNKRLVYLQRLRENIRIRFYHEYLGFLRNSHKKKTDFVKVGEIVLIGSDEKKRIDWALGRVIELLPGRDNIIRLVKLKTTNGEVLRPIQHLYPLEVVSTEIEDEDQKKKDEQDPVKKLLKEQGKENSQDEIPLVTRSGRRVRKPERYRP